LCNDEFIQRLNKNYRKKDKPTNVLSFPYIEFSEKKVFQNDLIGEVFISLETLQMEALEQSKKLPDHFSHLLVHSILHILGYDHEFDKDANKMENLEIKILKEFGIKNPYNY
jgi:probable rRNA maturation factor